jgi:hypothetical protein
VRKLADASWHAVLADGAGRELRFDGVLGSRRMFARTRSTISGRLPLTKK